MATATSDIDEIRRQMAQIRRELHQDVQDVVEGAEAVTDWRRYIRAYPWVAVGVATAVGYLIVPKRRRSVPRDIARQSDVAEMRTLLEQARASSGEKKERRRGGLVGAAFGMLAPMAWRAFQNYAMGYLEQWIAQQQQQYMAAAGPPPQPTQPPGPRRSPSPGWPGPPGSPGGPGGPRGS